MDEGFEIAFRDSTGHEIRGPLSAGQVVPATLLTPIRQIPAHRGQTNRSGLYWFSQTSSLVPTESLLETATVMRLDFSGRVRRVVAQPFRLYYRHGGAQYEHVPDLLAELYNGEEVVIDVVPRYRLNDSKTRRHATATKAACTIAGWKYRIESEPDPILLSNIRWLAGFRWPLATGKELVAQICEASLDEHPLGVVARQCQPEVLARPVIFHLMWRRLLVTDLTRVFSNNTLIRYAKEGEDVGDRQAEGW